jgi:hypothetical protein
MKKTSVIVSTVVSVVVLVGLWGCASNSSSQSSSESSQPSQPVAQNSQPTTQTNQPPAKPKKDKRPIDQRLMIGMSMDEVKAACGNPRNESANSDGSAAWTYASGSPTYNPFTGWGAKMHYVTVVFDTNGKVKSWSSSTTDNNPPPF